MRSTWRACVPLPALAVLAVGAACGAPELASDLDPEGPPEVLQINVRSESAVLGSGDPSGLQVGESATFCRSGDQYQVNQVYCPEALDEDNMPRPGVRETSPVTDAAPGDWYVRIIFDELLDPGVEELVTDESGNTSGHIDETRPVVLRCGGVELAYDGYYDPSGNHLSFPPGPGLVVEPAEFVATGTDDCEVTIVDLTDKDGQAVASGQAGPYAFGIAPLRVYGTIPADGSTGVARATAVSVSFGAPIDLDSAADTIALTDGEGNQVDTSAPEHPMMDGEVTDASVVVLTPTAPLAPDATYVVTVSDGVRDVAGGELVQDEPFSASFTTGE